MFEHIHPEAAHFLIAPSLRAISDVPGFTLEQKNSRAADAWAVITNVDPCDAYSLMLYGHAFVLNDLCADAGHDALTEAKSGMMPGTESPMKWRAMSAYGTMHRSLCQNVNAFLRVRKELTPTPPAPPGGRKRTAKQPATEAATGPMEPAEHAPPDAEDGSSMTGRNAAAASAHTAAASFVVTPEAADGERSGSDIVTEQEQNTAPGPDVARHAPEAANEARVGAGMPSEEAIRANLAPVAVPPAAPLVAGTMPAAADFARLRAAMVEAVSDRPVSWPPVIASEAKQPPNAGDMLSATNSLHPAPIDTGRNEPRPIPTQLAADPSPPLLAVTRSHVASTTPRRIRDGPRTNFSRRRSS